MFTVHRGSIRHSARKRFRSHSKSIFNPHPQPVKDIITYTTHMPSYSPEHTPQIWDRPEPNQRRSAPLEANETNSGKVSGPCKFRREEERYLPEMWSRRRRGTECHDTTRRSPENRAQVSVAVADFRPPANGVPPIGYVSS